MYIQKDDSFTLDAPAARECPHCRAQAQLVPVSTPRFATIASSRPRRVALGFRCAACGAPRFAKTQVRAITPERIELSSNLVEIEKPLPAFQHAYLPEKVRTLFSEALGCYAAGFYNAFASLSRRTAFASERLLRAERSGRWRHAFEEIVRLGELDHATTTKLETVLFGSDPELPLFDEDQAAILIEVMKDILYQCHVRQSKFRAALKMRRYFADESKSKVTPLARRRDRQSA